MERNNESRILSIVALVLAVFGLSVGFAAYSSTLNISANANVEVSGTEWDVGFASAAGDMAPLTGTAATVNGTGVTNAGTLNMLKYTLSQGTAATLQNVSGSSVTYAFKIKNAGSIEAKLSSIVSEGLTCAYNSTAADRVTEQDGTPNTGEQVTASTGEITDTDCNTMFTATLTINGTDYDLSNPGSTSGTIAAGASVDASLTIAATGTAPTNVPDGDFVVTLGATTVVYSSR